jgi:hypothetical protein
MGTDQIRLLRGFEALAYKARTRGAHLFAEAAPGGRQRELAYAEGVLLWQAGLEEQLFAWVPLEALQEV